MVSAAQSLPNEVACLLIPAGSMPLLLPNVTVAEIAPISEVTTKMNAPSWYMGNVHWRSIDVPLVSLSVLNGNAVGYDGGLTRVAVLNGVSGHKALPFFALRVNGLPRLIRVFESEISHDPAYTLGEAESMMVYVGGESAIIPNLEFIENKILKSL